MGSHVIVPGTNPWSSSAHGHLSLLREDQSLPGRVSGSFSAHALSPGLSLVSWKTSPVAAWALLTTGTATLLSCFPSSLGAVAFYFDVPGTFSVFWLFWRGMSDICCSGRCCMRVPWGSSRGAPRLGTLPLFRFTSASLGGFGECLEVVVYCQPCLAKGAALPGAVG